ncbi:FtsK/SpoIIIE domain-containing protein [Pseudonocardia halophobica]|uniref:Cell division protein FtsK n=1 Tax=Pseudonocardia halophobica TaxID=29401 RepID=A0A9W6L7H5_9PSEU|nr:FtsK/SpoIIIE domain-containing protein [Pseudonocardia halophobica]GLL13490.1 cell division protein FtsK [Pseudonocardia halophobica]
MTALDRLTAGRETRPALDTTVPILPVWLRDRLTFTSTAKLWARRNAYRSGRFTLHLPALLILLVLYSPRGLGRIVGAVGRYLYDHDSAEVRHAHAEKAETSDYLKAQRVRQANLRARWLVAGTLAVILLGPVLAWTAPRVLSGIVGAAVFVWLVKLIPGRGLTEVAVGLGAGVATWWFLPYGLALIPRPPAWAVVLVVVALVLALGWHGRPRGKSLLKDTSVKPGIVEPLRAPVVTAALCELGNSKMKEPEQIRLLMDPARQGPGYQIDLELPGAVPATWVIERREELAAALKRELGTVWPAVGKRNAAHLSLYVADQPLVEAPQKPWPLMKQGGVDLFQPVPMFTDQRGDWITLTFAYANMVIGALPRMGKTFLLRQALLVAGLDVRARVYAFDGKGTGDLAPCALYAHCYSVGDEPEEIERVLLKLRELRQEMRRRARVIRELPREEAPESKVTSTLANRRDLGLEPIVLGIDETQAYFEYGDKGNKEHKAIREELAAIVTDLVKRGPALGIIVILATQQVNAQTMPTTISNNAVIRACLKMFGQDPNDRVLGTGSYKRGIDATQFAQEDRGLAYLRAEGDEARIVRSVFGLDAVASEKVGVRARQMREAANRLTGDADDEVIEAEEQQVEFLADVRTIMDNARTARMHLGEIREALVAFRPATWQQLDNDSVGGLLRQAGVQPGTVWSPTLRKDGKGVKREQLDVAATETIGVGEDLTESA